VDLRAFYFKAGFSFLTCVLYPHRHRIIAEEDAVKRAVLISVADYTRRQLTEALKRLGITVPERM
jgi:arginyl-tRNA synthetase